MQSAPGAWWQSGHVVDYLVLPAGTHTLSVRGRQGWGGSSGDCVFSSGYGGGFLKIEASPI